MDEFRKSTLKTARRSYNYLLEEFDSNGMSNHKQNLTLAPLGESYKSGFVISANNDDVIMFNEFGTGVVGEGTSGLAELYGYEYNVGKKIGVVPDGAVAYFVDNYGYDETTAREILESETTPNTWWYKKNGKWHHTEGMRAKNMFSDLQYELLQSGRQDYLLDINKKLRS